MPPVSRAAREWTDFMTNGDFLEAMLNTSFDWNGTRTPYIVATENDALNAATALFGYLLSNGAQILTDVRTYWSPNAVKRVTGRTLPECCSNGVLHILNSGPAPLDATGRQETQRETGHETILGDYAGGGRKMSWCDTVLSYL